MSENTSPKKSNTVLFIGIGIAIVFFCCVCLAGVAAISQFTDLLPSISSLFGPKWASAKIIPEGADFYMAINPDFRDMSNAKHLVEVYSDVLETTEDTEDIEDNLREEYNISLEDDIKPWLGPEVAIAIPNLMDAMSYEEPAIAVIAATIDKKASDKFLEKLRDALEDDDYEVDENTYKEYTYYIQEVENDWETYVVFGRLDDFVVVTTTEDLMEDIIDTYQKKTDSLYSDENYKQLLEALPRDAAAIAYYDMEDWTEAILYSMDTGIMPPDETMEQLEAFKALGMAVSLDKEGIVVDFAVTFDPDVLTEQMQDGPSTKANDSNILERIPADALGLIGGQDLNAVWQSLYARLEEDDDIMQQFDDLGDSIGLSLDEDLFSWATGEYAITVIEASSSAFSPVEGYVIFEVSDQDEAEDTLESIADIAEDALYVQFQTEEIEDVEMQIFQESGISLGYGFPPQHLVIGFGKNALEAGACEDLFPISEDETFQAVKSHLPNKNSGYFYVNIENAWELAYETMGEYDQEYFDEGLRPYLEPLKAIGMARSVIDPQDGIGLVTLFFYIP